MAANYHPLPFILLLGLVSPAVMADEEEDAGEAPECRYCPDESGWSGWVEAGIGYQNRDDYRFGRYTGEVDAGALVNGSGELEYRDADGLFFDGSVVDLGLDSRRVLMEGGRQGRYQLGLEFDQIPNYRDRTSFSPYRERGDGRLGLPSYWVPGQTTDNMPELGRSLERVPLTTQRDRYGAEFSFFPSRQWEVSGYARREKKDGTKDIGGTFGFAQTVILPVPFDYETDEFGLTLGFTGEKLQSQISYSASLFENNRDAFTWQNPFEHPASNTAWGRSAEYPDNQFHQLSAVFGYQLLDTTHVDMRFARGWMTQDQDFLPYTINPSIPTTPLPTGSLDARIDTTLASFDISSRPLPKLRLDASYTYSDRDNKTDQYVYDYVVTDLGPGGSRVNRPYSFKQRLLRLKAAYRLPKNVNLSVGYDDDRRNRDYTEVDKTHEKTGWASVRLNPVDALETTLKYSHSKRDSSDYVPLAARDPLLDNPNENFYNNPLMRAYQFADRKRDKAGVYLGYAATDAFSLGLDLDYADDEYRSGYLGLQDAKEFIYTASATYAFAESLSASAYYTYDKLKSDQRGSGRMLITEPDDFWLMSDQNLTKTVGFGINWQAIEDKLDIGVDLTHAKYNGTVEFESAPDLPEVKSTLTAIDLHGNYKYSDEMSIRAGIRYEDYDENDWVKDGVVNTYPTLLSLGTGSQANATYLGFVSMRYQF